MPASTPEDESGARNAPQFVTTHWSIVLAARDSACPEFGEALEKLCQTYWPPLYAFVRRQGHNAEESKDLTQAFFARFLDRRYFGRALPSGGRFRSFLLTSLKHFLVNDWKHGLTQRRGGGQSPISLEAAAADEAFWVEPVERETPETAYERQWASTVLQSVLAKLRQEYVAAGKSELFEALKAGLWGTDPAEPYARLASRLGETEGALRTAAHRLRRRYGALLREEIAHTVAHPREIDDELRHLVSVLSSTS